MKTKTCLSFRRVGMTYILRSPDGTIRELDAVREVIQELRVGEFVTIIGPSGCGKSTLLEIVAGVRKAGRGDIYLEPEDNGTSPVFRNGLPGGVHISLADGYGKRRVWSVGTGRTQGREAEEMPAHYRNSRAARI